jgi:hypothetical protein
MSFGAQIYPKTLVFGWLKETVPCICRRSSALALGWSKDMGDNNLPGPAPVKGCSITTRAKLLWKEDWQNLAKVFK